MELIRLLRPWRLETTDHTADALKRSKIERRQSLRVVRSADPQYNSSLGSGGKAASAKRLR